MARNGGRPSKFTPEARKIILEAIAMGVPRYHAAERAGISRATLKIWMANGREATRGEFLAFLAAIKKAEADAMTVSMARIRKAAVGGVVIKRTTKTITHTNGTTTTTTTEEMSRPEWTADAWFLERRHPKEFALRHKKDLQLAAEAAIEKAITEGRVKLPAPSGPMTPTIEILKTIALESARKAKQEYKPLECPEAPPMDEPLERDDSFVGSKKSPGAREMDDDE